MATGMAKIHLFDLPGEIRNTIYKNSFGDLAFHTCSPDFVKDARRFSNARWSTSLFSVNHQVRREALSAFSENLTVYCEYNQFLDQSHTFPKFILDNVTKLVVCEDNVFRAMHLQDDLNWALLPKLEQFSLIHLNPARPLRGTRVITTIDDILSFLRGGLDELSIAQDGHALKVYRESVALVNMNEDNFRILWKIEPENVCRMVYLDYSYRIDFAPATWQIHTRRINVSQSRSYLFGNWVSADEVVLLVDEVSHPVVWSIKQNTGRVLSNRYDHIEKVEEELRDPDRLARAIEKAFRCSSHRMRKAENVNP